MPKKTMLWSITPYLSATERLFIAAQKGCVKSIKDLITKQGANPYSKNHEGNSPLHLAARDGHLFACEYLVEELKSNSKSTRDKCGQISEDLSINKAVMLQRLEYIVENKNKPPLDEKNNVGQTALFLATLLGKHCPRLSKQQQSVLQTVYNPVIALLAESGAQITELDIVNCKESDNEEALKILQKEQKRRNCQTCSAAKSCNKLKL
jgi:hypothetical protein